MTDSMDDQEWNERAEALLAGSEPAWISARRRGQMSDVLLRAIDEFATVSTPAGDAATSWLRERGLEHSSATTWLHVAESRLLGFCALASTQVALTRRQQSEVGSGYRATPGTLIAWIAKGRDSNVRGAVLLRHADAIARRVARLQGNAVLVLDAYDDEVADRWCDRYGFRDAARPLDGEPPPRQRRLWLPLDTVRD